MIDLRKKRIATKNSNSNSSPKSLQTLQKVLSEEAGSVTFVFKSERVENIHANSLKGMGVKVLEAKQHLNLTRESLYAENNKKKSPEELLDMLKRIQWDLGANYFILD